jgi:hypothetical protein
MSTTTVSAILTKDLDLRATMKISKSTLIVPAMLTAPKPSWAIAEALALQNSQISSMTTMDERMLAHLWLRTASLTTMPIMSPAGEIQTPCRAEVVLQKESRGMNLWLESAGTNPHFESGHHHKGTWEMSSAKRSSSDVVSETSHDLLGQEIVERLKRRTFWFVEGNKSEKETPNPLEAHLPR